MKSLLAFVRPRMRSTELRIGAPGPGRARRGDRVRTRFDAGRRPDPESTGKTGAALLPFTDLTPQPDHPYLADGFTRDLAQVLSLNPSFFAEAIDVPHTELAVEGAAVTVEHSLLIEGAIARAGRHLSAQVRVVDCASGDILWSDRLSAPLEQISRLQDDLAESIAGAVTSTPYFLRTSAEPAGTACPAAWALRQAARGLLHDGPEPFCLEGAVRLFSLASRLDPLYADAKIGLAETLSLRTLLLSAPDPAADRVRRDRVLDAAEVLAPSHAELNFIRGLKELDSGKAANATLTLGRAVRVNAIMIPARIFLSIAEARSGRQRAAHSDAMLAFRRAGRPGWTALADYARAEAALAREAPHDAETAIEAAIEAAGGPGHAPPPVLLMHSLFLAGQGRTNAAREVLAAHWPKSQPLPGPALVKPWLDALPGRITYAKSWLKDVLGRLSREN